MWTANAGDIADACNIADKVVRKRAISTLLPAIKPPTAPHDLANVPIIMSISLVFTPKCSEILRTASSSTPIEFALFRYRYTVYFFFTAAILRRQGVSPSIEYIPSIKIKIRHQAFPF